MGQPVWVTDTGSLGTIAEGIFFNTPVVATDPDGGTVQYSLVAGTLPEGIQVTLNGVVEGVPVPFARVRGVPTEVSEDVTSQFVIRASVVENGTTRINDRTFSLTVTGQDIPEFVTPAGSLGNFYDGDQISIEIEFSDQDPDETVTIGILDGELPPGLTLSSDGVISGYIEPVAPLPDTAIAGYDIDTYDEFPFDFSTRSISKNYEFTLKITDGKDQNIRSFSMFVYSRDSLTADTTDFTGDNNVITADVLAKRTPIVTNYPAATTTTSAGFIGTFRHDNFFAYQIQGLDLDGDPFEFSIETGDSADIPPNLVFERETGWLQGFFPDQGATELTYEFSITVFKSTDPVFVSEPYTYSIKIIGDIENSVSWLNGTLVPNRPVASPIYSLGSIDSGAVSILGIQASTPGDRVLQFRLKSGSYPSTPGVYNKLPQGLSLLPTGEIAGRATFNTFALDSGTTTFDEARGTRLSVDPTTFDQQFDFTVEAYSSDGLISVFRTFRIFLNRSYNTPYESLYIQAMPPSQDRAIIKDILQNTDLIPPSILYRKDDPYFGVTDEVKYVHAFSLDSATLEEYAQALEFNHFRKQLILGPLQTAQALDSDDNVIYEVVYSEIVDNGVNQQGESPPQSVQTAYPIIAEDESTETSTVYPNSLINMRDQVIDTVGQTASVLPLWMTSKQTNGKVLGFTRAWVIAYTKPGEGDKLAYNINDQFPQTLNTIDFEVDRYVLDRSMTKNWVADADSTDGGNWLPAKQTTFDVVEATGPDSTLLENTTTFDGDSLRFTSPVDTYEFTDEYNKYLVFPRYNILGNKEDAQHSTGDPISGDNITISSS